MINIANFRFFIYKLYISYASQDTFLRVIWSDRYRFGKKGVLTTMLVIFYKQNKKEVI